MGGESKLEIHCNVHVSACNGIVKRAIAQLEF